MTASPKPQARQAGQWVAVLQSDELKPGESRIVEVAGKQIGLFHEQGQFYAVLNFCPHAGAPICQGRVFGQVVCDDDGRVGYDHQQRVLRCPWHHWEFKLSDGKAVAAIPQKLRTYPVKVENQQIWVQV